MEATELLAERGFARLRDGAVALTTEGRKQHVLLDERKPHEGVDTIGNGDTGSSGDGRSASRDKTLHRAPPGAPSMVVGEPGPG